MLKTLIQQYPLVKVDITVIDRRHTLDQIQLLGNELDRSVYLWSLLQPGFQRLSTTGSSVRHDPVADAIESISSLTATNSGLYVFENLFGLIEAVSPLQRACCYQAISELFTRLNQANRQCLVILMESGAATIPTVLSQIITEYKFPLPTNFELATLLLEHGIDLTQSPRLSNILAGLTIEEITVGIRANASLIGDLEAFGDRLLNYKYTLFKAFGLEFIGDTATKDIGGMDLVKEALEEVKMDFTPAARECGLPLPRGWILVGVPGAGKTYFAKICAQKLGFPLVNIGIDVVKSGGVTKFKQLLNRIDACAPNMPYLDEFDKFFADEHGKELLGILLTWLNEKSSSTFVLATLNRLENLPPELTRAGRFDRVFYVDFPGSDERKQILQLHCARFDKRYAQSELGALNIEEWLTIIEATNKYTGAELAQMAIVAAKMQFYKGQGQNIQIDLDSLLVARSRVKSLYSRNPEGVLAIENRAKAFTEASSSNKPTALDLPELDIYV
jgi:ATPase family associated with various cellular activities (AAA)